MKTSPKLYEQVAEKIKIQIDRGILGLGQKVPSVRRFSRQLAVSPFTVVQAYWVLENKGLLESRPGSGFYVASHGPLEPPEIQPKTSLPVPPFQRMPFDKKVMGEVVHYFSDKNILLGCPFPDPHSIPPSFGKCLDRARRQLGPSVLSFNPPPGLKELRVQLARHYFHAGLDLAAEDFFLTAGAMEAMHLSVLSFLNPGDTVAVESPCFIGFRTLLDCMGIKVVDIPTDHRYGMDLEALKRALRKHKVKACYAMPNFSNPSGCSMSDEDKKALVGMLTEREVPLIENDIYGDIHFGEVRPKPAKAFDKEGWVMLCSSFSKTVGMGVSVGWAVPGRRFTECIGLKVLPFTPSAPLLEKAFANFLALGAYERHLRQVRKMCADNLRHYQETIATFFPQETRTARPQGGLSLWVEFPKKVSVLRLCQEAAHLGINVNAGGVFSVTFDYSQCLQLYFAVPWDEKVQKTLRTIVELAKKQLAEKR